jgi:hypothetical protein
MFWTLLFLLRHMALGDSTPYGAEPFYAIWRWDLLRHMALGPSTPYGAGTNLLHHMA